MSIINLSHDKVFHTLQGEGRFVGVPSVFIRLTGCNLRCQWRNPDGTLTLCDTPYTSFQPERNLANIQDVVKVVASFDCKHVVITGGEPFLQQNLVELVSELKSLQKYVTIETNATIFLETKADFISMSPKLSNSVSNSHSSSDSEKRVASVRYQPEVIARHCKHADHQLKFVINDPSDIQEVEKMLADMDALAEVKPSRVYLMPQGTTTQQLDSKLPWIAAAAKIRGWNITDRLHVRIWGNTRAT